MSGSSCWHRKGHDSIVCLNRYALLMLASSRLLPPFPQDLDGRVYGLQEGLIIPLS